MAADPTGNKLATCSRDRTVKIWNISASPTAEGVWEFGDTAVSRLIMTIPLPTWCWSVAIRKDGMLYTGGRVIRIFDIKAENKQPVQVWERFLPAPLSSFLVFFSTFLLLPLFSTSLFSLFFTLFALHPPTRPLLPPRPSFLQILHGHSGQIFCLLPGNNAKDLRGGDVFR